MAKHPSSRAADSANATKCGVLYVVATPIGNLGDLSSRAREILNAVDLVLAEDTRHTATLMTHFGIDRPLLSFHEHNEPQRVPVLLDRLRGGESMALVSDAGTPLVSDPGFRLVSAATAAGIRVSPVPGPSAVIAALSISGLPSDRFAFEGFLPAKAAARATALEALRESPRTMIFYEAPHRLAETLDAMATALGRERNAVVARELTKTYESTYRGTLETLSARAKAESEMARGEIVIVVEGSTAPVRGPEELDRVLRVLLKELPLRQAAAIAAELTETARNAAYRRALALGKS